LTEKHVTTLAHGGIGVFLVGMNNPQNKLSIESKIIEIIV
jgi:hypothetical protein